jgi:hypothetical protein
VFEAAPQAELEAFVRAAPGSAPVRRAWFLFEALTGRTLDADDAPRGVAVNLLDPEAYFLLSADQDRDIEPRMRSVS